MSDKKDDKTDFDLSPLEDLSEFNHEEEESFEGSEFSSFDAPLEFEDSSDEEVHEEINEPLEKSEEMQEEQEEEQEEQEEEEEGKEEAPAKSLKKEDFKELKDLSENLIPGSLKLGGHPPFALLINNIHIQEDRDLIALTLEKHGFMKTSLEKEIKRGLGQGSLLLTQLSEYVTSFLIHEFRHLHIDITAGPTHKIHSPQNYEDQQQVYMTKDQLYQNKEFEGKTEDTNLSLQEVFVSHTSSLPQKKIIKLIEHIQVGESFSDHQEIQKKKESLKRTLQQKALHKGGNALINLSYHIHEDEKLIDLTAMAHIVLAGAD